MKNNDREDAFVIWWRNKVEPVMKGNAMWPLMRDTFYKLSRKAFIAGVEFACTQKSEQKKIER